MICWIKSWSWSQEVHPARGTGLNYFEAHSFIRYGRVYAAVEYDEVLGCAYFLRDFNNPGKASFMKWW